jgi:glycosyltransferase involved in cell wall biosynthesis
LIPCRNGAATLPRLLASARAQTVPFHQIIVFDDAREESSRAVAAAHGASVISVPSRVGVSAARNRLAEACRTEWFHFHDADDILDPDYVRATGARAASGQFDVVVCDVDWYNPARRLITQHKRYSRVAFEADPLAANLKDIVGGIHGLYRKTCFTRCGGFDERLELFEDWEAHVRLAARGARFSCVEQVLATAYVTPGSASQERFREAFRTQFALLRRWTEEFDERYRSLIARVAERTAVHLLYIGLRPEALEAIAVCRAAGGDPPTSDSRLLRCLKHVLPTPVCLRLQRAGRAYVRLNPADE